MCLLNSFANPVHELMLKEIVTRRAPDLPCCISFEVLPEIKEYERTSTTVINTYVMPIVARYLATLREELDRQGIAASLLLMQSNGGLTTAEAAMKTPMHIIESGPAAGVIGAQALARALALPNIITFDMGGTTAKASIVEGGEVARSLEYQVGGGIMMGSRLLTGCRIPAQGASDRPGGGRGRRRLYRLDRCRWLAAGRAAQCWRLSWPTLLRSGRHGADDHRCQRHSRLHQSRLSGWGRVAVERRQGSPGLRGDHCETAGPLPGPCGLRRASDRRLEHDPRHQGGIDRTWP